LRAHCLRLVHRDLAEVRHVSYVAALFAARNETGESSCGFERIWPVEWVATRAVSRAADDALAAALLLRARHGADLTSPLAWDASNELVSAQCDHVAPGCAACGVSRVCAHVLRWADESAEADDGGCRHRRPYHA